jgi:hypothetical protein
MREDMAKVIVERPRGNRGWITKRPRSRWRTLPMDEWPLKESHKQEWREYPMKFLNENLAPLRRFLRSHVGQPWNDVVSEMRERINLNSAVQLHIWQHVKDYVCVDPIERNGKLVNKRGFALDGYFYVDPATGILKDVPVVRRRRKNTGPKPYIRIDRWTICRKLDGLWFLISLKPLPWDNLDRTWDAVFKSHCNKISRETFREFYGQYAYAASKRQLNKKEIASLKSRQMLKKNKHRGK